MQTFEYNYFKMCSFKISQVSVPESTNTQHPVASEPQLDKLDKCCDVLVGLLRYVLCMCVHMHFVHRQMMI